MCYYGAMKAITTFLSYIGIAALIVMTFSLIMGVGYILIDFSMNLHFNSGGLPARKFFVVYFKGLRRTIRRHLDHMLRTFRKSA